MTHHRVIVLLPEDNFSEIWQGIVALDKALAPFSEELETTPHLIECPCVGFDAEMHGTRMAQRLVGSWSYLNEEQARLWDETRRDYREYHPLYGKPAPDCAHCHGTGWKETTANPDAKYDYFCIGGRWNGAIKNHILRQDKNGRLADNSVGLGLLLNQQYDWTPSAVLAPDGTWHQAAGYDWGVALSLQTADWEREIQEIYRTWHERGEFRAVLVDVHI